MEVEDIRALAPKELQTQLLNLHQELFNLRLQFNTGQLTSPKRIREVRKDIAKMKTILREKEKGVIRETKS